MTWTLIILVMLAGLALSAFFSGAETGIYCISRLRLHLAAQRSDVRALRLEGILKDEPGALSVTLLGTNLMNYITTVACAFMFEELLGLSQIDTELYTVAFLTPIVFVFGEVVPKNMFRLYPDALMMQGSWFLRLANGVLRITGAVWFFGNLAAAAGRLEGNRHSQSLGSLAPKHRVAILLQDALAGDHAGREQSELIDRVCQLSDTPVHQAMVPRNRVLAIAALADRRELTRIARKTPHARLPVHGSHHRHVIGLAVVDDLLQADDWAAVGDRLQPAMTVSPHDAVASVISEMQRDNREMAVVTDRGGQMLGVVTLKDLLGEVIGEMAFSV
ncbi:MAG: DUF21 domain-containing protein [Phycisphaerales bacterium]|nr:MAG: DUF21 domain-containing protein [Phycisphaerales bacterium]